MLDLLLILVGVPVGALVIGIVVTWRWASGEGWRWGWRVGRRVEVGEGAYRSAPVDVREPRRLPLVCSVAAATSVAWGLLTLLIFAPAGLIMFAVQIGLIHAHWPSLAPLGAIGLLIASCHAFWFGGRLIGLVGPLVVRTECSATRVDTMRLVSTWHHALVTASFVVLSADAGMKPLLVSMIPCAIGFAHVFLLARARAALARLDGEDRLRAIAA
jgi:hypothetical protein